VTNYQELEITFALQQIRELFIRAGENRRAWMNPESNLKRWDEAY